MRAAVSLSLLLALAGGASAQTDGRTGGRRTASLFATVKPQATVVITKHPTGADLVSVTVLDEVYPVPDLKAACERVGALTGVPARGLAVSVAGGFYKATFATGGLIAPGERPRLRLAPVVRAFGFGASPLRSLAVIYGGESADATTVRRYANAAGTFRVEAQRLPPVPGSGPESRGGVEYRTVVREGLRETDVREPEAELRKPAPPAPKRPTDYTLPIVLGLGAVAAGLLVFALLLKPRGGSIRAGKPGARPR